jgi:hypothetical protein
MRTALRTIALISGVFASVVAVIIDALYSFFHVLGRVSGVTNDPSHFWWGLFVALIGFVGALLSISSLVVAALLMLVAGVALFWVVGWWAIFASLFFFIGAVLAFIDRNRATTTTTVTG